MPARTGSLRTYRIERLPSESAQLEIWRSGDIKRGMTWLSHRLQAETELPLATAAESG